MSYNTLTMTNQTQALPGYKGIAGVMTLADSRNYDHVRVDLTLDDLLSWGVEDAQGCEDCDAEGCHRCLPSCSYDDLALHKHNNPDLYRLPLLVDSEDHRKELAEVVAWGEVLVPIR